ncbi:MAG TPA: gamma-glutamylcyclotransferase family protein [Chitinophagaceae bacterium]|nr:gamma-glutamylcyclotransferase family protein [Chitinophagaceae bacterium]
MEQKHHQIFVYGSLRKGFHHPAYNYISRYFSFVSNARVKGVLSDMGDYPAAAPVTGESFIIGELYTIKNEEEFLWAIEQLDDYEGLHVEEGEKPLFRREITDVYISENKKTQAWVYWFNGDATGKPVIASGDVLEYLQQKNKP